MPRSGVRGSSIRRSVALCLPYSQALVDWPGLGPLRGSRVIRMPSGLDLDLSLMGWLQWC